MMFTCLCVLCTMRCADSTPVDGPGLYYRVRRQPEGARRSMLPASDEPDVVRFADNNGIIVEVRVAQ